MPDSISSTQHSCALMRAGLPRLTEWGLCRIPDMESIVWPKVGPKLSETQKKAREDFLRLWLELLPQKYGLIEKFNHAYIAGLPRPANCRTLEVGAGLGEHLRWENLVTQEYHCLELRENFCEQLRLKLVGNRVSQGDLQRPLAYESHSFDRIVAVHLLEHLPALPSAVSQIARLLRHEGMFDVVIPCEGGLAYSIARKISAERFFRRHFKMDYTPIIRNEHINTYQEIFSVLSNHFYVERRSFFPLRIPVPEWNLCAAFRLRKKSR